MQDAQNRMVWGGLQLADIGTKNVREPDLIQKKMKYIMVIL